MQLTEVSELCHKEVSMLVNRAALLRIFRGFQLAHYYLSDLACLERAHDVDHVTEDFERLI